MTMMKVKTRDFVGVSFGFIHLKNSVCKIFVPIFKSSFLNIVYAATAGKEWKQLIILLLLWQLFKVKCCIAGTLFALGRTGGWSKFRVVVRSFPSPDESHCSALAEALVHISANLVISLTVRTPVSAGLTQYEKGLFFGRYSLQLPYQFYSVISRHEQFKHI